MAFRYKVLHIRRQQQRLIDIPGAKILAHSPTLNQTRSDLNSDYSDRLLGEAAMTDVLISAGELADLLTTEPCVIIDTRNPDAYGAGHLPFAVNVHEIFTYLATSTP